MKILIGTKNPYKAGIMEYMLGDAEDVQIHLLKDSNIDIEVEEDGKTLSENAQKKAIEISQYTDMYVLASDGGVDIPALGDRWDILRNQRIVGHENEDIVKANKVLSLMNGIKREDRRVEYHLALALALKGKVVGVLEDITDHGYIVEEIPEGDMPFGMWMGHIWYYPKFEKTLTQLNKKELEEVNMQGDVLKEKLTKMIRGIEDN
jgi:XTP/dITP diphosphohydrolase